MAISPSIPTSFVPKQPVSTDKRRFSSAGNNLLLVIALIIFGLTIAGAVGTFLYAQFLKNTETAKAGQIITAQKNVSEDTINSFIRLRNRFSAANTLINQHVTLSQFFNLLETITVQSVHFDGIDILVADDRSAQISMTGEAQNFNALAAQSAVFSNQKYIKNAIFSDISVNKDNSVSFTLSADLDPGIVVESVPPSEQAVPVIGPIPSPVVAATSSTPAPVTSSSTLP